MKYLALAGIVLTAMASTAQAEPAAIVQDKVILSVTEEGWVTTRSAEVDVYFNIIQQQESADELKAEIQLSLKKLAPKTLWYITSSRQSKDQSGLNRWNVSASARVNEERVSGLRDSTRKLSRAGFKLLIARVDFSPSRAEIAKLMIDLRAKIYAKAAAEAARVSAAIGGATYQVHMVDFLGRGEPQLEYMAQPRRKNMAVQQLSASAQGGQGGNATQMPVSRKQYLSARVILGRRMADVK